EEVFEQDLQRVRQPRRLGESFFHGGEAPDCVTLLADLQCPPTAEAIRHDSGPSREIEAKRIQYHPLIVAGHAEGGNAAGRRRDPRARSPEELVLARTSARGYLNG